jgi:hypothetical protein
VLLFCVFFLKNNATMTARKLGVSFRHFAWLSAFSFTAISGWKQRNPTNFRQVVLDWDTQAAATLKPVRVTDSDEIDRVASVLRQAGFQRDNPEDKEKERRVLLEIGTDANSKSDEASKREPVELFVVQRKENLCAVHQRPDGTGVDVYVSPAMIPRVSTVGDLVAAHELTRSVLRTDADDVLKFAPSLDTKLDDLDAPARLGLLQNGLLVYRDSEAKAVLAEATVRQANKELAVYPLVC